MKTHFLFIWASGFCLLGHKASAQCNLHSKTDDFTGKTAVWSDRVKITFGGVPALFKGSDDDCTYRIYFQFIRKEGHTMIATTEDADNCFCGVTSISFKFGDGTAIIKNNLQQGQSKRTTLGEEHYSYFEITADELTEFSRSPISKFKVFETSCPDHPVIEEEFDSKNVLVIQRAAICMLLYEK